MSEEIISNGHGTTDNQSPFSADDSLRRRVLLHLAARGFPGLRRLQIEAEQGGVTLRGEVTSYYERQLAVHTVRRVAGVAVVHDRLEVVAPAAKRESLCAGIGHRLARLGSRNASAAAGVAVIAP